MRRVWTRSRDKSPSTAGKEGVDGVTAQVFSSSLDHNIREMQSEIRNQTYKFSRLRVAPIPKKENEFRIVAIPTVRDRLLQRALLDHLENSKSFKLDSDISYGFRKGKTLGDAQTRALALRSQRPWALSTDIEKFFDNIPREKIKTLIDRTIRSKAIRRLLKSCVDCELEDVRGYKLDLVEKQNIKPGLGLRQGMPVSPMLSNLILRKFDRALEKKKFAAVRYADDIVVFGENRTACENALEFIQSELKEIDLKVPSLADETKTHIHHPSDPIEFLGLDIKKSKDGYRLDIPKNRLSRTSEAIQKVASIENCLSRKLNIGQVVRSIDSFIAGHNGSLTAIDDNARSAFRSRLEAEKQKQLKNLIIDIIGEEVANDLSEEKLKILGVVPFNKQKAKAKSGHQTD